MASVDGASLREELDGAKARIAALRKDGKVSDEVDAVIRVLLTLLNVLIAVLLERTTRKTSRNSGLPPSQTEKDETARRAGSGGKGAKPNLQTGDNLRKTTVEETVAVEACDACGADLSGVGPVGRAMAFGFPQRFARENFFLRIALIFPRKTETRKFFQNGG